MKVWSYLPPSQFRSRYVAFSRFDARLTITYVSSPAAYAHRSRLKCLLPVYEFPMRMASV